MIGLRLRLSASLIGQGPSRVTSHPRDTPQFYLTTPSTCPYLPGREERKVFTHIVGKRARDLNDILTQGGFRRSQTIAYRPACESCRACISVRVLVNDFRPSANMRRVLGRTGTSSARPCRTGRPRISTRCSAAISTFATAPAAWST